jgi:diguanylate cyclase (GGDEF)-like protein/PAS domain S-box-containing protein
MTLGMNERPSRGRFQFLHGDYLPLELVVVAAVILTVLAFYFRDPLTQREVSFVPADVGRTYALYQYDDANQGGQSRVTADPARPLRWVCDVSKAYEYGYCGFGIMFDPTGRLGSIDLSGFRRAQIRVHYRGSGHALRVVLKNRDLRYSKLGAPTDEQINLASVPISRGAQTVTVALDQFAVAEWWREAAARPSAELATPDMRHVIALEFLTASNSAPGPQEVRVDRIAFQGRTLSAETWYGGIALAWLLLIGSLLFYRRHEVARWRGQTLGKMRAAINTIPHMVWSLDRAGRASFNRRWEDFTGVPPQDYGTLGLRRVIHREDLSRAFAEWRAGLRSGSEFTIELRIRHRSGAFRWVLACTVPLRDETGSVGVWYGTCTDVDDRVRAQHALRASIRKERLRSRQLKWTSEHDPMTRLPNRRAFEARLQAAVRQIEDEGAAIGLFLVDMDYFKHLNDTLGHGAGDELLRVTATRLRRAVRKHDFVARIGGDEFAVIVPGIKAEADLVALGNAVVTAVQLPLEIDGQVVRPGVSIGGAICAEATPSAHDFLKWADAALYALKRSGRGGFRVFEWHMLNEVREAAYQRIRAREAIVAERIFAFYQPKFRIRDGAVTGFEALLRYWTPEGTLGLPETIAEAFNDYELAAKIGELMQHRVARDVAAWIASGVSFGRVSINASPAEFLRDDYAERLLTILAEHAVPPARIEIEVTEHALTERARDYVARALKKLKSAGVAISLDDFGTGHSSLSHLRDFPVDLIKIDQSYVALIGDEPETAALVTGVIHLAGSLSLQVVAEGVETDRQLQLLRAMGCHQAQGLLLGAPVSRDEVPGQILRETAA